ncbi:MAG: pantetheine-phosphate adenylyltransferase, partial [Actinomyces graevenitzii]|nr:pantetheine-phosphate adenylyltransferase [Actinomyces graevenitzii]
VCLATASLSHLQNVKVVALHGLVASYAEQIGAVAIVKGLRNGSDLDSEAPMAFINTQLGGVETVFLPAAPGMGHISSSLVKDVASYGGNIDSLVPSVVATALKS